MRLIILLFSIFPFSTLSQISDTSLMIAIIREDTYLYDTADFEASHEIETLRIGDYIYLLYYQKEVKPGSIIEWFEVKTERSVGFVLRERAMIIKDVEKYLMTKGISGRKTRYENAIKFFDLPLEKQKEILNPLLDLMLVEVRKRNEMHWKKLEPQRIKIIDYSFSINTLEWPDFKISFINTNPIKTIKYVWVTIVGYNPVDDIIGEKTVKCIGPVKPRSEASYEFESLFISKVFERGKIKNVKVQYMDGTIFVLKGTQVL